MALALDQMTDREQGRGGRGAAIGRAEQVEIDAVAQDRYRLGRFAERDDCVLERLADRDDPGDTTQRPLDKAARYAPLRDQVDVGAARRDHDGFAEISPEPGSGDTVRIKVVRVDQVEIVALLADAPQRAQGAGGQQRRRQVHPDPRDHEVARVVHGQSVPLLDARDAGVGAPVAEAGRAAGKVRRRRHHDALHRAGRDQMAQPAFDKNSVLRLRPIRVESREGQNSQPPHCRTVGPPPRRVDYPKGLETHP